MVVLKHIDFDLNELILKSEQLGDFIILLSYMSMYRELNGYEKKSALSVIIVPQMKYSLFNTYT